MTNQAPTEVAIIGFGTAAVNAAAALRRCGYEGVIRLFSDHGQNPYSPILTSYYAGGQKTYDQCFPWTDEELSDLGLTVMRNCPVRRLDTENREIHTDQGVFPYAKCLVASGSVPRTTGFPQDCGYEPLVLRTMDDAERLREVLANDACKRVLVSGASMVALKMLEAALLAGKEVTLVGMAPQVLDFNAVPEAARRFEEGLRQKGVSLRLGQTVQSVRRREDESGVPEPALCVTFSDGTEDCFDEICVAHGMANNLAFLTEGPLAGARALEVDNFMRTEAPDVFAAGDVASAREVTSGSKRVVGTWRNAVDQGKCAGETIAAEMAGATANPRNAFKGALAQNTIAVDGTLFLSAGSIEEAQSRHKEIEQRDDMVIVRIYDDQDVNGMPLETPRLVGFNITCDADEPGSEAYDLGAMLTLRIERDNLL